jgi:hypothetical protein
MTLTVNLAAADGATSALTLPAPVVGSVTTPTLTINTFSDLADAFTPSYTSPVVPRSPELTAISTPYGPGFSIACGDADITPWDSRSKCILLSPNTGVSWGGLPPRYETVGSSVQWEWYLNLPPQNIVQDWFCGVLWEFHDHANSGNDITVDVWDSPIHPTPVFRHIRYPAGGEIYSPAIQFGHWYHFVIQVKWSTGSDGFFRWFLDGAQMANWTGANYNSSLGPPYLQFGWYSFTGPYDVNPSAPPSGITNVALYAGIKRTAL